MSNVWLLQLLTVNSVNIRDNWFHDTHSEKNISLNFLILTISKFLFNKNMSSFTLVVLDFGQLSSSSSSPSIQSLVPSHNHSSSIHRPPHLKTFLINTTAQEKNCLSAPILVRVGRQITPISD